MAHQMEGRYLGDLKVEYTHLQSGDKIVSASLVHSADKAESFMATELTACALAGCCATIMAKQADVLKLNIVGTRFTVSMEEAANPGRISRIAIIFVFPDGSYSDKVKQQLERAAHTCPVHQSLAREMAMDIQLVFPGDTAPVDDKAFADGVYVGNLGVEYTHRATGVQLVTDAPTDNGGRGAAFSPTDMCAASLAGCGMTIMGRQAMVLGVDLAGTTWTVTKTMAASPRRIAKVEVVYTFPQNTFSDREKAQLERACKACPVRASLHADMEKVVSFVWPG